MNKIRLTVARSTYSFSWSPASPVAGDPARFRLWLVVVLARGLSLPEKRGLEAWWKYFINFTGSF